jgi:hydrogenase maturation protease
MSARAPEVRILVCGTADRGDVGAAVAAISHVLPGLPDALRCRLEIRRCQQLDVTDLIDIGPGEAVIVIDTVVGVEAGQVVTMPLEQLARHPAGVAPRSSHALSIDDALLIAEVVRGSLPAGVFVGIGGKWFGYGPRFSRAVKASLPEYGAAIQRAIEDLLAPIIV